MMLAHKLLLLAIQMEEVAADIRSEFPASTNADELTGAAEMVREWARECESG
jgi:hypothetical protein